MITSLLLPLNHHHHHHDDHHRIEESRPQPHSLNDSYLSVYVCMCVVYRLSMQWYTMMNAHNIVPSGTGRHVIAMEDDVVLAEDFDELLRRALLEAEEKGDAYAMSLYVGNSMEEQVSADGEVTELYVETRQGKRMEARDFKWSVISQGGSGQRGPTPMWGGPTKYRWQRHMEKVMNSSSGTDTGKPRNRGSKPMLVEAYIWGHQAVVYSTGLADDFRAHFAKCERSMMRILEAAKYGDVHLIDEEPCIQVADFYNKNFVRNREKSTPFYTTRDSLVQHIGFSSAIQNIDGLGNMLFHHNVELGTVSEDYGDDTNDAHT